MRAALLLLPAILTAAGCRDRERIGILTGEAMGTTYRIKYVGGLPAEQLGIAAMCASLDRDLSTWRDDSWLAGFNRAPARIPLEMPRSVAELLALSRPLSTQTGGRFDPTVGALLRLWGLGAWRAEWRGEPSPIQVATAREAVGFHHLRIDGTRLTKLHDSLMLDFSGIAKGYAVDRMGDMLHHAGCHNFIIEFGGEVLASGNAPGKPGWTVDGPALQRPVTLRNQAIASSGSEHQFRNGKSHVIDPLSGRPLPVGPPVSATAGTCAVADALATAKLVESAATR